jgi:mono/diheme cytochrome c family protein
MTPANVERGKAAFLSKGCSKCHGEDGRGQTADNKGKDVWGFETRAADLTSGMLHGGNRPLDIYRRIYNGINGTPMPGFANALKDSPDTVWDLVSYVLTLSNKRREGTVPPPGAMRPYVSQN